MEELKAHLYVGRPFSLTSRRTIKLVLILLLNLLLCVGGTYYIYTLDAELGQMVLPILSIWAVVTYGFTVPLLWLSYTTIQDETLCVRVFGVFTKKYSKDRITRVWRNKDQLNIGLRDNQRLTVLDSPEARKILERLQIPVR